MLSFRLLAFTVALRFASADLPILEFTTNLLLHYKDRYNAYKYDDTACKTGACDQVVHTLLQPWQEWAMEQMGHEADHYTCDNFDDYSDCPHYPAFEGDKVLRYCSRCQFTNEKYEGITDVADLMNSTILKWTQFHTIEGVRSVLKPSDEAGEPCPCLGVKNQFMLDYYVSEADQRRRKRKFMRL